MRRKRKERRGKVSNVFPNFCIYPCISEYIFGSSFFACLCFEKFSVGFAALSPPYGPTGLFMVSGRPGGREELSRKDRPQGVDYSSFGRLLMISRCPERDMKCCGECFRRKKWHGRQNSLRIWQSARSKACLSGSKATSTRRKPRNCARSKNLTR